MGRKRKNEINGSQTSDISGNNSEVFVKNVSSSQKGQVDKEKDTKYSSHIGKFLIPSCYFDRYVTNSTPVGRTLQSSEHRYNYQASKRMTKSLLVLMFLSGALRGKPCIQLKNEHHLHTHFIVNILEHRLTLDQTSCTQKANYICEKVVQITEEIKANKSQTTEKDISKSDRKNANQVHNGLGEGVVVGIVIIICITIVAAIVIVGQLLKKIKRVDSSRRPLHRYQSNNSWSESGENNYINYPFTVPYNSTDTRSFVNPISSRTGCSVDVIPLQTVHESFDCSVTSSGVCSLVTSIHSQSANNRSRMNSGYQPRGGNKTSEESKMVF
ncbi:hypothetical protein KUTeg_015528 [Tegillarca granosa]|uniref:Uncharacterized protein n=1 Tax=Tegillarca granosa TaxID=220873 RepID=A0ABQ9EQF0_TEGGR|nr:hypothetical protein KUTeg_015528 [Tegillarca granosa]